MSTNASTITTQSPTYISPGGATFSRWGRTTCPSGNRLIYKGYVGGTSFTDKASSATILCLPEHPLHVNHTQTAHYSLIYGTEFFAISSEEIFNHLHAEDMPCVVCESGARRSAIMVPAWNQCYPGWNLEYWGYIMGAAHDRASGEYICVDNDPEVIPGSNHNNGQVLNVVEGKCGSLPCPPYI